MFSSLAASRRDRTGFSLIELLVVIAVITLLVSILLPSMCYSRAAGRKGVCTSNLKQFGVGMQGYATDFTDRLVSFTWRKQVDYGFGGAAGDVNLACANQAVDIMRRRAGRTDIQQITGWIPFILYNHLVMNDYLGQRLPEPMVACPEDRLRLLWQKSVYPDPLGFERLAPNSERPGAATVANAEKRWPYSSSYQFVTAFWSPDQCRPGNHTVHQAGTHSTYFTPVATDTTVLGERKMSEVQFPSTKVAMYDGHARHPTCGSKPQWFHLYEDQTQPLMFFDTSVRDAKTSATNRGFNPDIPTNLTAVTNLVYTPAGWEPLAKPGVTNVTVGHYRWSRGGLRGNDIKGSEVR